MRRTENRGRGGVREEEQERDARFVVFLVSRKHKGTTATCPQENKYAWSPQRPHGHVPHYPPNLCQAAPLGDCRHQPGLKKQERESERERERERERKKERKKDGGYTHAVRRRGRREQEKDSQSSEADVCRKHRKKERDRDGKKEKKQSRAEQKTMFAKTTEHKAEERKKERRETNQSTRTS